MNRARRARTLLCIALLLALTACSGGRPVQPEPTRAPDVNEVGAEAMLEDIDYMLMMLKHNYPFYDTQTTMFTSTVNAARDRIARGQVTIDTFREEVDAILACFVVRAHLGAVSPSAYRQQKAAFGDSEAEHVEYALWNSLFDSPRVREYYEGRASDAPTAQAHHVTAEHLRAGQVALAVLPTFEASRVAPDSQSLLPFYRDVKNYPHLILDLRGNGGGTTEYWMRNILGPLQRAQLQYDTAFLMKDGMINRYFTAADTLAYTTREWIESSDPRAQDILRRYGAQADLAGRFSWIVQSRYRIPPSAEEYVGFKGKLYVLCDGGNASAAEAFIAMCKMTGFATLIGTTTGGDGLGSGDPMYIALPNTGLLVRYTATYALNPDGTCNQVRGTVPDVEIGEGEDALAVCLEVIDGKRGLH